MNEEENYFNDGNQQMPDDSELKNMMENQQEKDDAESKKMEKGEKFIELAEPRVSKVIKAIQLIGNLSNRSTYHYDTEQVEEMFGVIEKELSEAKSKFRIIEAEKKSTFSFKSKSS